MRFKIRTKLIIAFLSIIFSFIVIGGILAFYSANIIDDSVHKIKSIAEERALIANLIFDMERALMPGNDYIITGDKKYIDEFYKASDDVEKIMKEAELVLSNAEAKKIVGDSRIAFKNIKEITQKIFETPNPVGDKEAARLMEEMDYKWAYPSVEKLENQWKLYMEEYRKAVNSADRVKVHSWIIMIVGTFILIAIGSFFALFYSRLFVLPIKQVHNGADAIAKGDFKVRLDIKTGDEIEQLSKAMNEMAKQLNALYLNMGENIEEGIRKFAAITESANDAIIVLSSPDVIHFWNKKAEEIFGYKIDEVAGKSVHDLVVPQKFREKAKEGLNNFFKTGQGTVIGKVVEVFGMHKDGREFPIELSVSAVRIGEEWQAVGIIRDISERKRLENGLRESEELYRGIFENTPNAMLIFDAETWRFENVNRTAIDLYGYTEEEFLSLTPMDVSAEEEKTKKAVHNGLAEKSTHVPIRYHKKKDGTIFPIEIFMGTFFSKGRKKGFAVIVDLTETKKAEEKLNREKKKAETYLDIADVIIIAIDSNGKVNLINKKGCEVLGYQAGDLIGKDWFDNFIPQKERDAVRNVFNQLMAGNLEKGRYFENLVVNKSGEEKLISWHNIVLTDDRGRITGTLSSGEDITDKKKAETELKQRVDELEKFRKVTIQRELRMEELKRKNKELEEELKRFKIQD